MATFLKGDIVIIPFPFSDLTQAKRARALVIVGLQGNDLILCQITSRLIRDQYAIAIDSVNFESSSLQQSSNVRPNRLFTADQQIVLYQAGRLKSEKTNEVIAKIIEIL